MKKQHIAMTQQERKQGVDRYMALVYPRFSDVVLFPTAQNTALYFTANIRCLEALFPFREHCLP
jgi:hypothetical protein